MVNFGYLSTYQRTGWRVTTLVHTFYVLVKVRERWSRLVNLRISSFLITRLLTNVSTYVSLSHLPKQYFQEYTGDLNSQHLNSKILLVCYSNSLLFRCLVPWYRHLHGHRYSNVGLKPGPLTKWWSEYPTTMERGIWIVNHSMIEQISTVWIKENIF